MRTPVDDEFRGAAGRACEGPWLPEGTAAHGARVVLLDNRPGRRRRLHTALADAGVTDIHLPADLEHTQRLLEQSTLGTQCAIDLLLIAEELIDPSPEVAPLTWAAHPAWREVALLALRDAGAGIESASPCDRVDAEPAAVVARVQLLVARRRECLRLQRLLDLSDSLLLTLAGDGRVHSINHGGCELLGREAVSLIGRDWFDTCVAPAHADRCRSEFAELLAAPAGALLHGEQLLRTSSGEERSIAWRFCPWSGADGRVQSVLCAGHDVTEREAMRSRLDWQSNHDLLTGLFNRSAFESRLAVALESTRGSRTQNALLYLDVDQFQVFNDTCGYEAGDELLRQLGGLLCEHLTPSDVVARLGTDQFAVLLHECSQPQALRSAARIQGAVESFRFLWAGRAHRLGISIGVVGMDADSESAAAVLGAADAACHAAKLNGGGRTRVYQPDDVDVLARQGEMQWVLRIKRALDENRFQLWMQPIERIGNSGEDHYELLLRMLDEEGKVVLPGAFLPAAERFHLSTRIDRWVIRHAFQWLAAHTAEDQGSTLCCINLSGLSMGDEAFLDYTIRELHRHGVGGERLCFEITETAAIGNLSGATRFIRALKAEGVRFALDDFGSGLSSFAYLKTLPVDFLKIDGVFVKDMDANPIDFAMVKSIHEVARVMGKETIGEFVESPPVLARLREIGVHFAQGYAVGKPRPLETGE